jgi:uncharacterized protein (TIGR03435 family)
MERAMHMFATLNISVLALLAGFAVPVFGQERQGFDVASVRPAASADGRALLQATPGRLAMTNLAPRRLILNAYDIQDYQLVGGPGWIDSDRYDIQAKAEGNPTVRQMEGPMLQVLLEERFKLLSHRETRQLAVYKLSVGKSGAKLRASQEGSCTPYFADAPPPTTKPGEPRPIFCGFQFTARQGLHGKGVTMAELAKTLSRTYVSMLGRNVIDGTGLTGAFDIDLTWATDSAGAPAGAIDNAPDLAGPSIFTALQEQLGLKLESTKGPVEVLVIDHIEKPSEN